MSNMDANIADIMNEHDRKRKEIRAIMTKANEDNKNSGGRGLLRATQVFPDPRDRLYETSDHLTLASLAAVIASYDSQLESNQATATGQMAEVEAGRQKRARQLSVSSSIADITGGHTTFTGSITTELPYRTPPYADKSTPSDEVKLARQVYVQTILNNPKAAKKFRRSDFDTDEKDITPDRKLIIMRQAKVLGDLHTNTEGDLVLEPNPLLITADAWDLAFNHSRADASRHVSINHLSAHMKEEIKISTAYKAARGWYAKPDSDRIKRSDAPESVDREEEIKFQRELMYSRLKRNEAYNKSHKDYYRRTGYNDNIGLSKDCAAAMADIVHPMPYLMAERLELNERTGCVVGTGRTIRFRRFTDPHPGILDVGENVDDFGLIQDLVITESHINASNNITATSESASASASASAATAISASVLDSTSNTAAVSILASESEYEAGAAAAASSSSSASSGIFASESNSESDVDMFDVNASSASSSSSSSLPSDPTAPRAITKEFKDLSKASRRKEIARYLVKAKSRTNLWTARQSAVRELRAVMASAFSSEVSASEAREIIRITTDPVFTVIERHLVERYPECPNPGQDWCEAYNRTLESTIVSDEMADHARDTLSDASSTADFGNYEQWLRIAADERVGYPGPFRSQGYSISALNFLRAKQIFKTAVAINTSPVAPKQEDVDLLRVLVRGRVFKLFNQATRGDIIDALGHHAPFALAEVPDQWPEPFRKQRPIQHWDSDIIAAKQEYGTQFEIADIKALDKKGRYHEFLLLNIMTPDVALRLHGLAQSTMIHHTEEMYLASRVSLMVDSQRFRRESRLTDENRVALRGLVLKMRDNEDNKEKEKSTVKLEDKVDLFITGNVADKPYDLTKSGKKKIDDDGDYSDDANDSDESSGDVDEYEGSGYKRKRSPVTKSKGPNSQRMKYSSSSSESIDMDSFDILPLTGTSSSSSSSLLSNRRVSSSSPSGRGSFMSNYGPGSKDTSDNNDLMPAARSENMKRRERQHQRAIERERRLGLSDRSSNNNNPPHQVEELRNNYEVLYARRPSRMYGLYRKEDQSCIDDIDDASGDEGLAREILQYQEDEAENKHFLQLQLSRFAFHVYGRPAPLATRFNRMTERSTDAVLNKRSAISMLNILKEDIYNHGSVPLIDALKKGDMLAALKYVPSHALSGANSIAHVCRLIVLPEDLPHEASDVEYQAETTRALAYSNLSRPGVQAALNIMTGQITSSDDNMVIDDSNSNVGHNVENTGLSAASNNAASSSISVSPSFGISPQISINRGSITSSATATPVIKSSLHSPPQAIAAASSSVIITKGSSVGSSSSSQSNARSAVNATDRIPIRATPMAMDCVRRFCGILPNEGWFQIGVKIRDMFNQGATPVGMNARHAKLCAAVQAAIDSLYLSDDPERFEEFSDNPREEITDPDLAITNMALVLLAGNKKPYVPFTDNSSPIYRTEFIYKLARRCLSDNPDGDIVNGFNAGICCRRIENAIDFDLRWVQFDILATEHQ